jgi:hypothetical protein
MSNYGRCIQSGWIINYMLLLNGRITGTRLVLSAFSLSPWLYSQVYALASSTLFFHLTLSYANLFRSLTPITLSSLTFFFPRRWRFNLAEFHTRFSTVVIFTGQL